MAAISADHMAKFKDITSKQTIDEQAKTFLRAFVGEFQGKKFEEVLNLTEEFRKFAPGKSEIKSLDEQQAHLLLEKRGEAKTIREMRDLLRKIDIDTDGRLALLEYLLFKFNKTPQDLFTAKPNKHLVEQLEKAIDAYQAVFKEKRER